MHNALRWFLLWTLFPFVIVAADPPPPLVRSVLDTNLPPFGLTGQALFRTANLPYLDWSNIVQQVIDTNAFQPASANLTNWSLISTNALTGKLDSNVWWAAWGSLSTNALTGKLDSNYWFTVWGAIATNALTAKLDSNWWWTAYGSKVLTNSGAFIASQTGKGTNTVFFSSSATTVSVVISNAIGVTTNVFEIPGTNGIGNGKDFVVTADGKVGFGTNLPQAVFDFYARSNGPSQYILRVANGMVANQTNAFAVKTNGSCIFTDGTAGSPSVGWASEDNGSGTGIFKGSAARVSFAISGAERHYFESQRLFVTGYESINGGAVYRGQLLSLLNPVVGNATNSFEVGSTNPSAFAFLINSNANIGVGTNFPQSRLHVTADNSAANVAIFGTTNKPSLHVITTNGYTGIRTNLPQNPLHVVGPTTADLQASPYIMQIENPMVSGQSNTFVILTNGNTAIGTFAPSYKLAVWGDKNDNTSGSIQARNTLGLGNSSVSAQVNLTLSSASGFFGVFPTDAANNLVQGRVAFGANSDALGLAVYAPNANQDIRFFAGSTTERMRIYTNGNVGINTNSPQSALHVTGDNSAPNVLQVDTTNRHDLLTVNTNGHVGIGTNNPQAVLHVTGTNGPSQYIVQVENPMVAGQTNAFVVTTNNRVGIGVSAPSVTLDIGGTIGANAINLNANGYINWNGGFSQIRSANTDYDITVQNYESTMVEHARFTRYGMFGVGTNSPQARMDVIGDNSAANILRAGTTNRPTLLTLSTNGDMKLAGAFTPTNGIINLVSNSFIANLVIVTNNPQIYCLNGTNQLITLPDCTKIPVGQIMRFSSTNGYGSFTLTNATGSQTIRDGTSLSLAFVGVGEISVFNDGAAWWLGNKTKTIWPNASWSTSTNVPLTVAGSNYVTYNQLETSNGQGITLTNGYQIYVRDFGQYLFTFSIVTQIGAPNATNRVWLQQSGQNVPRTRTDVKMSSTAEQYVMTVNFILPVTTNLTWFGLCVRSTDTGAQLVTGAAADATMPAMPSAIVTVNKISDTFP